MSKLIHKKEKSYRPMVRVKGNNDSKIKLMKKLH